MARSSQLHKLNTRGYNSQFERKALSKIRNSTGTDTAPAIIDLTGLWSGTDTITVTLEIGGGDLTPAYSPSGNEDMFAAASGLATQIDGETGVDAVAAQNAVFVTKTTAGTVNLLSSVIA